MRERKRALKYNKGNRSCYMSDIGNVFAGFVHSAKDFGIVVVKKKSYVCHLIYRVFERNVFFNIFLTKRGFQELVRRSGS